jgi:uncharacterized protein (DUF1697 family)
MRTTAIAVKQIIDTDLEDEIVESYIQSANVMVTNILGEDTTLNEETRTEIERWFTAHLIASTREQQIQKAKAGPAEVQYQGRTYSGLYSTMYGQQVNLLDPTGKMANLGGKTASMQAIWSFSDE